MLDRRWMGRGWVLGCLVLVGCESAHTPCSVRASLAQLHITHARPGADVVVFDPAEHEIARGPADALGSYMARRLAPGAGYHVESDGARSRSLTVRARHPRPGRRGLGAGAGLRLAPARDG